MSTQWLSLVNDHSQTRTLSVIINPKNSKKAWRVQPINNSIIRLRTLMLKISSKRVVAPWESWETWKSRVFCRQRPTLVTEKAKRMMVMIKKGRWMGLRRVPPSSEKMSHRRHRRNEAEYTPIRNACKVVAMRTASAKGNIWSTTATCNLTRIFILWPIQLSERMERKYDGHGEPVAGHQSQHWFHDSVMIVDLSISNQ